MPSCTLDIPDDLALSLSAYAKQLQIAEDELILKAIDHYLMTVLHKRPNSIGIVSDGSLQSDDVEDWLLEHWLEDIERGWNSESGKSGESAS